MASQQKRSVGGCSSCAAPDGAQQTQAEHLRGSFSEQNDLIPACHLLVQQLDCVFSQHRSRSFEPYRVQLLVAEQAQLIGTVQGSNRSGFNAVGTPTVERTTV